MRDLMLFIKISNDAYSNNIARDTQTSGVFKDNYRKAYEDLINSKHEHREDLTTLKVGGQLMKV